MPRKKITLQDVARAAKVSTATVSRVANGNSQVEAEIQTRVLAAARRLGIDLTSSRKNCSIAFVLGNRDTLNEFQSQVLMGAESYCAQRGWDLQFISFVSDLGIPTRKLQLPQALTRKDHVGGVILSGTHSASVLAALRDLRIPFSVLGNNIVGDWRQEEYDCVTSDDVRGASEVTQHLIAQGHRSIYFLGDQRFPWYARCAAGYLRTMHDAGLEPTFSEIHSGDRELGYLAAKSLLVNRKRPTAIFAGNDQAAAGVYGALQESGVRIPDDISVAGFNDTVGSVLHPALTTAREFPKEQGRHLAEFVLRRIQDPDQPPQQVVIPTELIRRDSVGAVAASGNGNLKSRTTDLATQIR
jgi:DNA-binding LacI/PurR family transcriptional regulator